jgi:hypothetical protein
MVFSTTRPWDAAEFIHVDNFKCVYTETVREGFRVRLPGSKWATVEQLKAAGYAVTMPRARRID